MNLRRLRLHASLFFYNSFKRPWHQRRLDALWRAEDPAKRPKLPPRVGRITVETMDWARDRVMEHVRSRLVDDVALAIFGPGGLSGGVKKTHRDAARAAIEVSLRAAIEVCERKYKYECMSQSEKIAELMGARDG